MTEPPALPTADDLLALPLPDGSPPELREAECENGSTVRVVRDDLVLGGTKARVAPACIAAEDYAEWVFAGPSQGYAQLALVIAANAAGVRSSFFTAKRKRLTYVSEAAARLGLNVVEVPAGRLTVVRARAREHIERTPGCAPLIPMGLHLPGMGQRIQELVRSLPIPAPPEVWVACGSGLLSASIARAWPAAHVHAVVCGMRPEHDEPRVSYHEAPEAFADDAKGPLPPFPSVRNYDAKVWQFATRQARPDAVVWNVGR